jgi:hypothetical protein
VARGLLEPTAALYTKNGRPLQRSGDNLFSRAGKQLGGVRGDRVYGPDGRYAGPIVGNQVVYRSTHSARISSPFAPRQRGWNRFGVCCRLCSLG